MKHSESIWKCSFPKRGTFSNFIWQKNVYFRRSWWPRFLEWTLFLWLGRGYLFYAVFFHPFCRGNGTLSKPLGRFHLQWPTTKQSSQMMLEWSFLEDIQYFFIFLMKRCLEWGLFKWAIFPRYIDNDLDKNHCEWSSAQSKRELFHELRKISNKPNKKIQKIRNQLWVFGGFMPGGVLNELWIFDLELQHWTKTDSMGDKPSPRQAHTTIVHENNLFLFGGCDYKEKTCFQHFFILNTVNMIWTKKNIDE